MEAVIAAAVTAAIGAAGAVLAAWVQARSQLTRRRHPAARRRAAPCPAGDHAAPAPGRKASAR